MAVFNETAVKKPRGKIIFRISLLAVMVVFLLTTLQILFDLPVVPFLPPRGNTAGAELTAVFDNGVQKVSGKVEKEAYPSLIVQRGIPVEFTLTAEAGKITDCNNELIFPAFNLNVRFKPGANVLYFTPKESGVFPFSCWMDTIKGTVTVVESLGFTNKVDQSPKAEVTFSTNETNGSKLPPASVPGPGEMPTPRTAEKPAAAETSTPKSTAAGIPAPNSSDTPVFEKKDTKKQLGGWLENQITPKQGAAGVKDIRTWTGWIFDRDCVGISPVKHTKACNLMGSCFDSGLGIFEYVPGKAFNSYTAAETFLTFDGASKELAVAFLKAFPEDWKNNVTVTVTGYAVNNIPAAEDELLIPETDISRVDHYLNGIHITSIEAAYIDGLSTNSLPEPNIVFSQP